MACIFLDMGYSSKKYKPMKAHTRNLAFLSLLSFALFSCDNKEMEAKIADLNQQNQLLEAQYQQKDSALVAFIASFAEIEHNLKEIRERELNIELAREENLSAGDLKARINEDVQEINRLLEENREKFKSLNAQLAYAGRQNAKLKASMEELQTSLTAKIEEKESQINGLSEELGGLKLEISQLNTNIASLQDENQQKEQAIIEKTDQLNTAYFVAGTYKQLRDEQILIKEGGFLGLGKTEVLNDQASKEQFRQIDIRETLLFPLEGEAVELVTTHPAGSYRLEKENDEKLKLVVADPEKFWESSKYLVMVVK
jgi:DNA repair exonuclease SbcCD ATPase subunit